MLSLSSLLSLLIVLSDILFIFYYHYIAVLSFIAASLQYRPH